jgi:hypothetical protein
VENVKKQTFVLILNLKFCLIIHTLNFNDWVIALLTLKFKSKLCSNIRFIVFNLLACELMLFIKHTKILLIKDTKMNPG